MHITPCLVGYLISTAAAQLSHHSIRSNLTETDYACANTSRTTEHVSYQLLNTTSTAQWTYNCTAGGLDGPKVKPVNSTTFEWWYFDAVSANISSGDLSSVVVVFYTASPDGFPTSDNDSTILDTSITGSFADGTPFSFYAFPAEATISTEGDGSAGEWGGYADWDGITNPKRWVVKFNDSDYGISGEMVLQSNAPPHLPCGPVQEGGTEVLMPHIGWSNAVPDAVAEVNFTINGTQLAFKGPGYHDQNWGDQPFFSSVDSWYWGHSHLGPYSIVWFDARDIAGVEYFSSYVAKDGQMITGSCTNGTVLARPWGPDTYPPTISSANPDGFLVSFTDVEGKELVVNVTNVLVTATETDVYDRWIGTVEGHFADGSGNWTGVAQYEEFKA